MVVFALIYTHFTYHSASQSCRNTCDIKYHRFPVVIEMRLIAVLVNTLHLIPEFLEGAYETHREMSGIK